MPNFHKLLDQANEAVDLATTTFLKAAHLEQTAKGDRDYATETDFEIERALRQHLGDVTPDVGFLGEEDGRTGNENQWWCLDPIDGTVNYRHGHPLCGISLAFLDEGVPSVGVIDFPWLGQRFSAYLSGGASCNGEPIQVSGASRLEDAVIAIGDYAVGEDAQERNEQRLRVTKALAEKALRVRMHGSSAIDLSWVASGTIDACVAMSNHPWDVSAGVVIAREAGAQVMDADGANHTLGAGATVATNTALADQLIEMLQGTIEETCPQQ